MNGFRISSIGLVVLLAASPVALATTANPSASSAPATQAGARSDTATPDTSTRASGITKQQALKEIQLDGYTNVQDLRSTKHGWEAMAKEGGRQVSLLVDNRGNVEKTAPVPSARSGAGTSGHPSSSTR